MTVNSSIAWADTNAATIPMQEFIGTNGFHEDDIQNMGATGFLRAYCNWDWFEGDNPGDVLRFQNSRGGWYFDDAFRRIKNANIKTVMCFQGAIKNLHGTGNFKFNDKPTDEAGLSTTSPDSYKNIASTLFQMAARYGKTVVAKEKLRSDDKFSGLDLLEYIEVWNEPDKDWEGAKAQFSPEEYAAMLSICYDKIKEADPKMKVAMGGLATLSVDYVRKMNDWFQKNRADKKFAADVINCHIYGFSNSIIWGKTWPLPGPAETPEDARFKEKTKELVDYCKQAIGAGAEVWISEFGWDTNAQSVLSPKKIAGLSLNELQARWLVRGYLEFVSAGISRAQMFALADPSQNYIDTFYGTAGLLDRTLGFSRKTSWYYIKTLKTLLAGMIYAGELIHQNSQLKAYVFKEKNSGKGAYVLWSNSSEDKSFEFTLPLSGKTKTATIVELSDQKADGTSSVAKIENNGVKLNVSEKPVFIMVDQL